jgi:hypothetical protein
MKKFVAFAMLLSLGLFTIGCEKKPAAEPAPAEGGAAAPAPDAAAPPAEGEAK